MVGLDMPRFPKLLTASVGGEPKHQDSGQRNVAPAVHHRDPELNSGPSLVWRHHRDSKVHRYRILCRGHTRPIVSNTAYAQVRRAERMVSVDSIARE